VTTTQTRWPPGHEIDGDWVCACGYDFFGGTTTYGWALYLAHVSGHGWQWTDGQWTA
jgi:hypothetical protein